MTRMQSPCQGHDSPNRWTWIDPVAEDRRSASKSTLSSRNASGKAASDVRRSSRGAGQVEMFESLLLK